MEDAAGGLMAWQLVAVLYKPLFLFKKEVAHIYWDINKSRSYNCLFNFIVGARGVGKTYGCKEWAIRDYLKTGSQFIYMRRFKEELKKSNKFFDDICQKFEGHELKASKGQFYIDGGLCGTTMALSTAKIEKSTPFPRVNKIIFDEFILDKGYHHYLPDEVTNFLEAYSTVARLRDVYVYFLSNALTITNPYFIYFDLSLPYGKSIKAKGDILIEVVSEPEFEGVAKKTRAARILEGTPYARYSIENEFLRDNRNFLGKKTPNSIFVFSFIYKGERYGVWLDYKVGLEFVSTDYDASRDICYSFTLDDHTPNTLLLKGRKPAYMEDFIKYYKLGLVRFESMNIKNIVTEVIRMTL